MHVSLYSYIYLKGNLHQLSKLSDCSCSILCATPCLMHGLNSEHCVCVGNDTVPTHIGEAGGWDIQEGGYLANSAVLTAQTQLLISGYLATFAKQEMLATAARGGAESSRGILLN